MRRRSRSRPASATTIATGGVIPRGADAVVMIEHTDLDRVRRRARDRRAPRGRRPGQFVSYAGSDIARGEVVLRRGARIGSREIGMLAACGIAEVDVVRQAAGRRASRPATSWSRPATPLRPAAVYDSNGAIIAAAVAEAGGEPVAFGAFPTTRSRSSLRCAPRSQSCDLCAAQRAAPRRAPAISRTAWCRGSARPASIVHGVALKPGKPLCLAVIDGKPLVVLPGFPTSAIFTFHAFVAPLIRARAGLPPEAARTIEADGAGAASPPSSAARNSCWWRWSRASMAPVAFPTAKGSGSVTSFSQADGFLEIDALASPRSMPARVRASRSSAMRLRCPTS